MLSSKTWWEPKTVIFTPLQAMHTLSTLIDRYVLLPHIHYITNINIIPTQFIGELILAYK